MDVVLLALRLLLALLLYGFLAALFVMLWRDIRKSSIDRQGPHLGGRLVVLETTDGSVPEGTAFPVLSVTSIGRGPGNTVLIPDTYASAQHALLTWREGQWWLEDLGSRNGTQLNDELVDAPTVVVTGDIIRIGRARLKVELDYGPGVTEQDGASNRLEPGPGEGAGDPTDTGG